MELILGIFMFLTGVMVSETDTYQKCKADEFKGPGCHKARVIKAKVGLDE